MLKYKGKDVVAPPNNTKYIPVRTYDGAQESNMAITDIQVVGDTPYCKIGDNAYLWKIKQALKLTDIHYKAEDLGYDTSIEIVPDGLDASELTTTKGMFSRQEDVSNYFKSAGGTPTMSDLQTLADNFDSSMVYSQLKEAPAMDTSNVTDMSYMFGCNIGKYIPQDYDDPLSPRQRFKYTVGCTSLTTVPQYDTSKVTNFSCMFAGCTSIPKVFPWTINAYGGNYFSLSNFGNGFDNMFSGSSVEEITFLINTAFYAKAWFDNKDPLDFFRTLDQENGLKKVTVTSGRSDDKVVIDNDGVHYYGLSANY
jgi:hypothetical protein